MFAASNHYVPNNGLANENNLQNTLNELSVPNLPLYMSKKYYYSHSKYKKKTAETWNENRFPKVHEV